MKCSCITPSPLLIVCATGQKLAASIQVEEHEALACCTYKFTGQIVTMYMIVDCATAVHTLYVGCSLLRRGTVDVRAYLHF